MRFLSIVILTLVSLTSFGQSWTGKYQDYFGHYLTLNKDSTFRFDWKFDLVHDWAIGKWTVSDRTLKLSYLDVYDTLLRQGLADSLVLSIDETSNKITEEQFGLTGLVSGGQDRDRFNDKFRLRSNRLYIINKDGELDKRKLKGIWPQKKWPFGYKKWPTFYKKDA